MEDDQNLRICILLGYIFYIHSKVNSIFDGRKYTQQEIVKKSTTKTRK